MRIANRVSRSGRFLKLFVLGIGLVLPQGTPPTRADRLFFRDGFTVEVEHWPAEYKGIDDALAAGVAIEGPQGD